MRGVGRGDDDVGCLELGGKVLEADGAAAEALGEAERAVVAAVGDEHGLDTARGQRPGGQLGGLAGADQQNVATGRGRRGCAVASPTAAEGTLMPPSPIRVSSRTRLPAASAPRNRRLRIAPVAPSTRASS